MDKGLFLGVCRPPGVVCRPPGVVYRPPGVVCRPPGVVCRPPGVVCRPLGVVCRPPGVVCRSFGGAFFYLWMDKGLFLRGCLFIYGWIRDYFLGGVFLFMDG